MAKSTRNDAIRTRIWREEAEAGNPFSAAVCRCHGYDVHGDLLGRLSWVEYLYLLFQGEAPTPGQRRLLEDLAVLLANPGPRDPSVHAAMAGGVGGSTAAACLMAALAVGAGGSGGARELWRAMHNWELWGDDFDNWSAGLRTPPANDRDIWPTASRPAGFEPYGTHCAAPIRQALDRLSSHGVGTALAWLGSHRDVLEDMAGAPLGMVGVAAAALVDLGFSPDQGEILYLLLRLPGAAVHALEQREYGYKKFPFFKIDLLDDPEMKRKEEAE